MKRIITTIIILICSIATMSAQFGGFGNTRGGNTSGINYSNNNGSTSSTDTIPSFSFKQYFNALAHKDTMAVGWAFASSVILPGTAQIYNEDYWKLPIIYVGIGGMIGGGVYFNQQYQKTGSDSDKLYRNLFYAGAALFYWGQMMDGVASYKSSRAHLPGRATIYSALLPGLGQIYNGEYWKLPIYYGGLAVSGYMWHYNNLQFRRFQSDFIAASNPDGGYTGTMTTESLKYYRDYYRRMRDYSIVATVLIYILQIIDADVFATMKNFEVNQTISMGVEPAIITPISEDFTRNMAVIPSNSTNAVGVKLNFTF
ncbi:MAG: hypothetical protein IKC17_01555 [Bacteroidales bacterium]|nr:hypothetical protein [Bacteroidales bacterium]